MFTTIPVLSEAAQIADRWKGYCEDLHHDEEGNGTEQGYWEQEPPPQQVTQPQVLMTSKQNCSKQERQHWTEYTEYVWRSGKLVSGQKNGRSPHTSYFPRKVILNCENYRTTVLVSHASKILLRIILERIRVKTETKLADEQAGFRQGRGARDQMTNLRILMHKAHEHQQPLYMCFVDFKKAFDSISHDKLWVTMMDMEYPLHLNDLLTKLYRTAC